MDVELTGRGTLAEVVLDTPPLNLFDGGRVNQFLATLDGVERRVADRHARAVILRSAGPTFCAGLDAHEFQGHDRTSGEALTGRLLGAARCLAQLDVPTVAAIRGFTLTLGFELALACDRLVA